MSKRKIFKKLYDLVTPSDEKTHVMQFNPINARKELHVGLWLIHPRLIQPIVYYIRIAWNGILIIPRYPCLQ